MIQYYLRIIRRWIWLLALATLVTGITGYAIVKQQPRSYSASARVIIGPGLESPDPGLDELRTAGMLMQTYAELITTRPTLESVIKNLDLQMMPDELARHINLHTDDTTRILTIGVEVDDPIEAMSIANALAATLVDMGPVGAEESQARIQDQTRNQIAYLEQEIANLEATLAQLEQDFVASTNAEERRLLNDQISLRRSQLSEASRNVIALEQSLLRGQTNRVRIIEPATFAVAVESQLELTVIMAALAGLILALVLVFLFEYLGDAVRSEDDLVDLPSMPVLGVITKHKLPRGVGRDQLIAYRSPESRATETYRLLASKLILNRFNTGSLNAPEANPAAGSPSAGDRPLRSLLISGTHINNAGSGQIAANLAVILAQTGHRVVLVDANLHQPEIGPLFGVNGRVNLTNFLSGQPLEGQLTPISWLPTLSIVPSGPISAKSFDLLASTRMTELIRQLEDQADLVLIAASPLLLYADSLVLSSRVGGVVVVAEQGTTRRATLVEIAKSLQEYGAATLGVVLNQNRTHRWIERPSPASEPNAMTGASLGISSAKRVLK